LQYNSAFSIVSFVAADMAAARDFIAGAISSFKEAWPGLINHTITNNWE
jgi:hypothetical protein